MSVLKIPILIAAMLTISLAASAQQSKGAATDAVSVPHATVEGCLDHPSAASFVLVRASGKKYILTGKPSNFDGLTGKEIRVYGALKSPNALAAVKQTQAEMAAGPPEEIVVEEVTKIDNSCENGASGTQPSAVKEYEGKK
jgi:hypothetical protein